MPIFLQKFFTRGFFLQKILNLLLFRQQENRKGDMVQLGKVAYILRKVLATQTTETAKFDLKAFRKPRI